MPLVCRSLLSLTWHGVAAGSSCMAKASNAEFKRGIMPAETMLWCWMIACVDDEGLRAMRSMWRYYV
jgi:hypothetical protein